MRVLGKGPLNAKIALVGEAPGAEEEARGEPFVGASGYMLNQMLTNVGIRRDQCYITNVVKTRPPENNFGTFYEDKKRNSPKAELVQAWSELRSELAALQPNITIALGAEALRALTGKRSLDNWRGSLLRLPFTKLIATYHPAYLLRVYRDKVIAECDLRRAASEAGSPDLSLPVPTFTLSPTFPEVMDFLRSRHDRLSFDFETSGTYARCLGLSQRAGSAICIPFISKPRELGVLSLNRLSLGSPQLSSYWSIDEEWAILRELRRVFEDPEIPKIAQNAPFDTTVFAREMGISVRGLSHDTMVAHHCLYPELPKGLDFQCSMYTRHPCYWEYDCASDIDTWRYCSYDAMVTLEIAERQREELKEYGLLEYYQQHLNPYIPQLTLMQNRGVRVNLDLRAQRAVEVAKEMDDLLVRIKDAAGITEDLNLRSSAQKVELLYSRLGLPMQYHHKTKNVTADKNALEKLVRQNPDKAEVLQNIQLYSELATLRSSFLEKELGPDGRFYTSFNLTGTENGRLSSSKPIWGPGGNLQNMPKKKDKPGAKFRRIFLPPEEDWSLIKADLSQAQFWIVVWLAKIDRLIRRYYEDASFDIHRWVAHLIYKKPESDVQGAERDIAKNGVYGGSFRMHYTRAAMVYKLPLDLAKWVLDEYHKAIPEIHETFWVETEMVLNATRRLVSPLGGHRLFFDRLDNDLYRSGYACLPQMIEAQIVGRSLVLAQELFDPRECYPLIQVHDEGVYACRRDRVPHYARMIRKLMEYPVDFTPYYEMVKQVTGRDYPKGLPPLTIKADVSHGPNWLDQEKIKEN